MERKKDLKLYIEEKVDWEELVRCQVKESCKVPRAATMGVTGATVPNFQAMERM
jgi:hypothetical protein